MPSIISVVVKLEELIKNTQFQFIQSNGQRIYCPLTASKIPKPPRGCEIFIGNLPPDMYEDVLIPLFARAGPIYSFRMMLDFFGNSRGYAFVMFQDRKHAFQAISRFHKYQIGIGLQPLVVSISVDNRRLFVGRIPKIKSREEVKDALLHNMDGVINVHMNEDLRDSKLNRGFAFVEFESHKHAALARKKFASGVQQLWERPVYVDWAEPLPIIDPEILEKVSILYLNNLPSYLTLNQLNQKLCEVLKEKSLCVSRVYKHMNYAFVHFFKREYAEIGFQKLIGLEILGRNIGVEWARPASQLLDQQNSPPREVNKYCKSVPRGHRFN